MTQSGEQTGYTAPAIVNLFFPGVGQMMKGEVGRGIGFLIGAIVGYFIFVVPGLAVHIWSIVDAYRRPARS